DVLEDHERACLALGRFFGPLQKVRLVFLELARNRLASASGHQVHIGAPRVESGFLRRSGQVSLPLPVAALARQAPESMDAAKELAQAIVAAGSLEEQTFVDLFADQRDMGVTFLREA